MFSVLRVPNEKIKDKFIANVKDRVTSIKHILGDKISYNLIFKAMKHGFEEEFNIDLINGSLTEEEINLANKFEKECFSANYWNHRR
jgi:lipoate-protein ligase A